MSQSASIPDGGLLADYHRQLHKVTMDMNGPVVYRGQENGSWRVESGAYRRIGKDRFTFNTLIDYHNDQLKTVRLRGWNFEDGGRDLGVLEQLAKLRHFGAANCLVDFTTSFDVALWFACRDEEETVSGKVFVADIGSLDNALEVEETELRSHADVSIKKILLFNTRDSIAVQPVDSVEDLAENPDARIWYWDPETLVGRMASQKSHFIFGPDDIPNSVFSEIPICARHKKGLLGELKLKQNICSESIFSDIFGFASINSHENSWMEKSLKEKLNEGMQEERIGHEEASIQKISKAVDKEEG